MSLLTGMGSLYFSWVTCYESLSKCDILPSCPYCSDGVVASLWMFKNNNCLVIIKNGGFYPPLIHRLSKYSWLSISTVCSLTTGRILDTFAETPPMSTFLLALAVFDFSSLISDGGKFTSWTVPANLPFATHGHRAVPRLVRVMEAIAGCELPLPKMDQIALPRLNPVAMENWGINTYRFV